MILEIVRVHGWSGLVVSLFRRQRRIVLQPLRMEIEVDRIEPESIDAAIHPEAGDIQQSILDLGIVKVQVGLFGEEIVQVVLHAPGVPLPGRAAEDRQPVVRRRAIGFRVCPDIPAGLRVRAVGATCRKPRMLVGRMRDDAVDHDFQAQAVRFGDQRVEVGQRAEHRIDAAIIGHVVAEILHR